MNKKMISQVLTFKRQNECFSKKIFVINHSMINAKYLKLEIFFILNITVNLIKLPFGN